MPKTLYHCANCGAEIWRWDCHAKAAKIFCGRSCADSFGRVAVKCFWPHCEVVIQARRHQRTDSGIVFYQIYNPHQQRTQFPLCDFHHQRIVNLTKANHVKWVGLVKLLDDQREYLSRVLSVKFVRLFIFDRDYGKCRTCSKSLSFAKHDWHLDHIKPLFKGGKTTLANTQLLCIPCHDAKTVLEKSDCAKSAWHHRSGRQESHFRKNQRIEQLEGRVTKLEYLNLLLWVALGKAHYSHG